MKQFIYLFWLDNYLIIIKNQLINCKKGEWLLKSIILIINRLYDYNPKIILLIFIIKFLKKSKHKLKPNKN